MHVPGQKPEQEQEREEVSSTEEGLGQEGGVALGGEQKQKQGHGQVRRSGRLATHKTPSSPPSGQDMDGDDNEEIRVSAQHGSSKQTNKDKDKPKSLVMVFGEDGVRRADQGRKQDFRARRARRRVLSLEGMGGPVAN